MSDRFRVIAIVSAFNEADIISPVIQHLVENGIDVYLLDNHSTDETVEEAGRWLGRGLLEIETFPPSGRGESSAEPFGWASILARKEELATTLSADWFLHHDADEIRESPWPGLNLHDAIEWVDARGYNCIDFRVLNFPPVDDGFARGDDPRTYFEWCEDAAEFDSIQLKGWKKMPRPSLQPFGGHEVQFEGRRIFPIRFLLRHYPIRGQTHGRQKVFEWRKGRFLKAETDRGWHLQYNAFADDTHCFLRDPATLRRFDLEHARLEQMLPDKDLLHLARQVLRADEALDRLKAEKNEWQQQSAALDADLQSLKRHADVLERDRQSLTRHGSTLEKERDALRQHAAVLEHDRDSLRRHATTLESDRDSLRQHATVLEQDRASLQQHAANLTADLESLRAHAANLERELEELRRHARNLQAAIDARATVTDAPAPPDPDDPERRRG